MKAMILAAGEGRRLRPLTLSTPKPLVEIGAKPLLLHHLQALERAGFKDVVINTSWLAEKITAYIETEYAGALNIELSYEAKALETGGGVYNVLSTLCQGDEPFLVLNSDVLTDFDFASLPHEISCDAHLYMVPNPAHNQQGDFYLQDNLIALTPSPCAKLEDKLTFSGISLLTQKLFRQCSAGAFSLGGVFRDAAVNNKLSGESLHANWFDVGTLERMEQAEQWINTVK